MVVQNYGCIEEHNLDEVETQTNYHGASKISAIVVISLIVMAIGVFPNQTFDHSKTEFQESNEYAAEKVTLGNIRAPLSMQGITGSQLFATFFEKYNLLGGNEGALFETIEKDLTESSEGWAVVKLFSDSSCGGTEYAVGGIMTGVCFPVYDDDYDSGHSFYVECESGECIIS